MPDDASGPYLVVPAPLWLRILDWPPTTTVSVVIDGPCGAVELQIHPELIDTPGGGMSIEYHSRTPTPVSDTPRRDCVILGGDTCHADGIGLGSGNRFEKWIRAGQGQHVVDELVGRYLATWPADRREPDPGQRSEYFATAPLAVAPAQTRESGHPGRLTVSRGGGSGSV